MPSLPITTSDAWAKEGRPPLDERARAMLDGAIRLATEGRFRDATTVCNRAVGCYQHLANSQFRRFGPALARAIATQSELVRDLGDFELAAAKAQEVADLCRSLLAEQDEANVVIALARATNNLSNRLAEVHRAEEALAAAEESVALCARPSSPGDGPPATLTAAVALGTLSRRLSTLGCYPRAARAARRSVVTCAHVPGPWCRSTVNTHAMLLLNLAHRLDAVGDHDEALVETRLAAAIHQRLVESDPERYRTRQAWSLIALEVRLMRLCCAQRTVPSEHELTKIVSRQKQDGT